MNKWALPLLGGAIGIGTTGLIYLAVGGGSRGKPLILVADNVREDSPGDRNVFWRNAEVAATALRSDPIGVRSAADIVSAVRSRRGKISPLVMIGHGTESKFFEPRGFGVRTRSTGGTSMPAWISPENFAAVVGPKAGNPFILSLAGCSAALNPEEVGGGGVETIWHGGERSLAAQLRDALAAQGVVGEVRAHSMAGTVLINPRGRTFYIRRNQTGQPGVSVVALAGRQRPTSMDDVRSWDSFAQGAVAARWLLGGELRRG